MSVKQRDLKKQILSIILRSGGPSDTQYIADQIALPEGILLNDLLTELLAEGRLVRGFTLTVNGKQAHTYSLSVRA